MRRGVSVVLLLLVSVSLSAVVPAVGAQPIEINNTTETPRPASDWEPPGPFTRDDLTTGGIHDAEAPPSVRGIGDPISGSIGVRTAPPNPLESQKEWRPSGSMLESDVVQLRGTAYGDAAGEYELVVVYWDDRTKTTENGTNIEYAADQSVQRVSFNMTRGYNNVPIRLHSNYDEKQQVTMWLERDGERVDGARWRYEKRSNPLTASPDFNVNSKGDLWRWGALNILLPAIPGMFVGRKAAVHFLDRTITSPRKGTAWWLIVLGMGTLGLVAGATWQTAAVLSQAPFIAGLSIAALSFVVILGVRDEDVEKAELNQKDLTTVTSVSGEESKDARSETIKLRDIVRRDGKIFMPAKGIRPFIARYWADAASIDESDLKTVNNTDGDVSKKYEIDPEADTVMEHEPAKLSFSPTFVESADDEKDEQTAAQQVLSGFGRINWQFIGAAVGGGLALYLGMQAWLDIQSLSMLVALLPAAIAGTKARDGRLHFEPAPYHFSEARANLVHERQTHQEAKTFDALYETVADLNFDMLDKGTEIAEVIESQFRERLNEDWEPKALESPEPAENPGVSDD